MKNILRNIVASLAVEVLTTASPGFWKVDQ